MAIKIKKRNPARDVEPGENADSEPVVEPEVDQVLAVSQDSFGWLSENWQKVVAGIAVVVVGIGVGSTLRAGSVASRAEAAQPALRAIATTVAAVGNEAPYATGADRAAAIVAAADEIGDGPVASALSGVGKLAQDDASGAVAGLDAFVQQFADAPESLAASFGLAAAQAQAGQLDAARATLDSVGERDEALAVVAATQGARLVDAFGTPEQALAAYREVVAAHGDAPGRAALDNRITQIEIQLGVAAAPAPDEGSAPTE
ncbi:MAG: tetratricopeptide repeat protein [Myxococcales bacterium]|nr:tetratricopeptide repeat protein [Myxococcales bacterium]MCB9531099.1 tetratricopeptide repeat protein [Myxococcales bacterium]MCB9533009.1 tetratricopeptide repeat protein [Myxococcales bacterium]